jgi:hypothetical protein
MLELSKARRASKQEAGAANLKNHGLALRRRRACGALRAAKQLVGEAGWLKALRLGEYAARKPRRPAILQEALFACLDAI